jgi:signal transduction histidine kinase
MSRGRLRYLIPAGVSAANVVLALVCVLSGVRDRGRAFPGFFYHPNATVSSMQRGSWEGPAAGLRPGDVVRAVDGRPTADGDALDRALASRPPGRVVALELWRPSSRETLRVSLRMRQLDTADWLATFVLPVSIGIVYLLLGAVIFFLKRSYEAALGMSICVVASVFYLTTFDAHTAHRLTRIWVAYPLLGAVSFHLFAAFPGRRPGAHRLAVLAVPYALAAAILALAQLYHHDWRYAALGAPLSSGFLALCFVADLVLLSLTASRDPSPQVGNKAKTIRVGLLGTVVVGVVWNLVARVEPELITAERAMMFSGLFPILFAYVTIKKNLFDVDFVLRTTSIYAIATAAVVALYFAVVYLLSRAMGEWTQRYVGYLESARALVISTLIVALVFHPLRVGVQRLVDRFFFRGKAELLDGAARLGGELAGLAGVPAVAERLTREVARLMRCRFVVLCARTSSDELTCAGHAGDRPEGLAALDPRPLAGYLQQLDEPDVPDAEAAAILRDLEVALVVPLRAGGQSAGALLLGPRRAGALYARSEREALRGLSVPAALALQNAFLLEVHAERERLATLGQFAAVIVHEIKNPLGIIRVSSGTLKKRFEPGDSGHELASFIEEEVVRMNHAIAQFLTFARPSPPKVERVELGELVRRSLSAARPELEEAGIALECEVAGPVWVRVDAEQLQRVLLNLVVNARQALADHPGGRLRVTVDRTRRAAGGAAGRLIVSDNGPGIAPDLLDRIFEPFFTTRRGGTGLGLAIARQLLAEQGGAISVRSSAGQGADFTVLLPSAACGCALDRTEHDPNCGCAPDRTEQEPE